MDLWNDPDLLNNPEKLMQLQWTQEELESATDPQFRMKADFVSESILQDSKINVCLCSSWEGICF
jgi:hypothetical protein